jgi:NB-ARC domain
MLSWSWVLPLLTLLDVSKVIRVGLIGNPQMMDYPRRMLEMALSVDVMADWMKFLEDVAFECDLSPEQKRAFWATFDRSNANEKYKEIVGRTKDDEGRQVFAGEAAFTKLMTAVFKAFQQELFPDLSKAAKNKREKLEGFLRKEFSRRQKSERPLAVAVSAQEGSGLNPGMPMQRVRSLENYVERPEALKAVKELLLEDSSETDIVAIYGMGGLGKSSLAEALACEEDISHRFPDGILRIVLGQQPQILSELHKCLRQLRAPMPFPTQAEDAIEQLKELLIDRKTLLIVDDVWKSQHLQAFCVSGENCQILLTAREAADLPIPDRAKYPLPLMSQEEAINLIRLTLGGKWQDSMREKVLTFASEVGYLPLALKLGAGLVKWDMSWELLLQEFKECRVAAFKRLRSDRENWTEEEQRYQDLDVCFEISLKRLSKKHQQEFAWIGVLHEDSAFDCDVAATLWNCKSIDAQATLSTLHARSLLTTNNDRVYGNYLYQIHDLLHIKAQDLICQSEQSEVAGLSLGSLAEAHVSFLGHYKIKINSWHELPNDGYIHRQLIWHMEQADWSDEVHKLMAMSNDRGRNAWFEACEEIGDPAVFVQSIADAWRLAEELCAQDKERSIILQCHYALIQATLNSLNKQIASELLAGLIQYEIWPADRVLRFVETLEDDYDTSTKLAAVIPFLPADSLEKATQIFNRLSKIEDRARVLARLSARKPDLFALAYEESKKVKDSYERAKLLTELSRQKVEIFKEACMQAKNIPNKYLQAISLIELLPQESSLLQDILELAEEMTQGDYFSLSDPEKELCENERAFIYSKIISYEPIWLDYVLKIARKNFYKETKANILANLAKYYDKVTFLDEAIYAVQQINGSFSQSELMSFLRDCDKRCVETALDLAKIIDDTYEQFCFLGCFFENQENAYESLLEMTVKIKDPYQRGLSLLAFKYPSIDIKKKISDVKDEIEEEHSKANFMLKIASESCDMAVQKEICKEVLDIAESSKWGHRKSLILQYLASHEFSKLHIKRMKKLAITIEDPIQKASALSSLAKYDNSLIGKVYEVLSVESESKSNVFIDVGYIGSQGDDAFAYNKFLIIISLADIYEKALVDAEKLVEVMQSPTYKSLGLCRLSLHTPDLCSSALQSTANIGGLFAKADALIDLATCCSDELFPEIMDIVDSLQVPAYKAQVYGELIQDWSLDNCSHQFLSELLHVLANRPRRDLLKDLRSLQPAISRLGGEKSMNGLISSVKGICSQWP